MKIQSINPFIQFQALHNTQMFQNIIHGLVGSAPILFSHVAQASMTG